MGENVVLKRRMRELGLNQEELARLMNDAVEEASGRAGDFSARSIRNLVNGTTRRPIGRTCAALEKVFGCSVEELGFRAPLTAESKEDPVRRRTLMSSAVACVPGAGAVSRVGQSDVARLEGKFTTILLHDHRYGGRLSIETQASALAGEALSLLQRGTTSERVRSRIYGCAASFTSSALWAAIDGRRFNEAQRYVDRASSLAAMSGDPAIQFRIWSHAGTLYRHLGRPVDALSANNVARNLPVARRDPLFASLGHARHAAICGLSRDAVAVDRALGMARSAMERAQHEVARPAWLTAFFGQSEVESLALTGYLGLGDHARAEAHAHRALSLIRPHMQRSRAITTARLARAQLGQGDLEPAVETAVSVGEGPSGRHPRIASMLRDFGAELASRAPSSRAAVTWREYVADREGNNGR